MIEIFIDRINSAPLQNANLTFELSSWIANLVDSLNENLLLIQENITLATRIQNATQAEILAEAATAEDSTIWYCVDHAPPCVVVKQNGVLVQLLTAAFP